ncbi:PAS domain-containing protein [Thioclava indica]|uniref:histidine kinase n=1 Tax=Thioclava indica TaxID=1353528 RepID=A0A074JYZ8_9RHOB|nr:PAS domain-containing protein [Thioclava indica]KEO61699.1 hypothetical protein DT23_01635 [Thioclava indica]
MRINLDALYGAAPSPYVLLDPDLRMVWANEAYLEVTGRPREALIGRVLTEEFPAPPDSVSEQMLRGSFRRVLATGKTDHLPLIPYPIETPDGEIRNRYWSATHTPVLGPEGQVEFILQNTMDVTETYHGKEDPSPQGASQNAAMMQRAAAVATENLALSSLTEFFRSAFEQAPSFMAILNGRDHVFEIANQSYMELVGERDIIGKPVRDALPELAGQGFFELLDRVYTSGEPVSMKGMPAVLETTSSGAPDQHYVDFIFHPLRDEKGASKGIFVQGHEVTGQKIAESTLTATREKFRVMAQTMPNHVWTADKDGALNWLNARTCEFTGFAEGELYGPDWVRVVHPDDLDAAMAHWSAAIEHGASYETEFRIRKADGSFRWHLVRASPLRADDGTLIGWVGTNTDIEERKTAEAEISRLNETLESRVAKRNRELEDLHATLRQSQKMEAIGNLAGGIAHDFNNLLQVITGNLHMAARDLPEDAPAKARLDQAMRSVKRGATLASQLLSFARKQPLAPEVINLGHLIENTTEILGSAIGEGVELETRLAEGLWNTHVDPSNLENAVLNLAINARDAMEGQGKLVINLRNAHLDAGYAQRHPDARPGQYLVLSVTDTGSGIDAETLERIFEPFFTTKTDGRGTGLGLSMVYGFAKQSGGHVTIESEVGSGTTVSLYLPRSLEPAQAEMSSSRDGWSGGTETILLVEDDEDVRATTHTMLTDLGYNVHQAANGDAALALVQGGVRIDLLFTDVVMPGAISGHDLAERLRESHPDVPVLFTSGYVQDTIVHDGQLDAGVRLLSKPFTQDELARKIRESLGGAAKAVPPAKTKTAPVTQPQAKRDKGNLEGLCVLLCEDNVLIRLDLAEGLRAAGCNVLEAGSAASALDLLNAQPVAILITDVGLPDRTGEELAADARALHSDLPVIFATGDSDVDTAAVLGNCKVLGKPFDDRALLEAINEFV